MSWVGIFTQTLSTQPLLPKNRHLRFERRLGSSGYLIDLFHSVIKVTDGLVRGGILKIDGDCRDEIRMRTSVPGDRTFLQKEFSVSNKLLKVKKITL